MALENIKGTSDKYFTKLKLLLNNLNHEEIDNGIALIADAWQHGRKVICLGNGGSALTANHFITDWNKSIFLRTGKPFRGHSLSDNMGLITAYANDISYADVFSEQLKNMLDPSDLVIAISGSGNSENVIRAVNYANEHGGITLGLCGYDGGKLKHIAQHTVWINANDMQLSEDLHFIFGHIVMQRLCGYLD